MKKLLLLFVACFISLLSFGQASMIISTQGTPQDTSANNYVWVGANFRIYAAKMDSLKIKYHNVKTWFPDTMLVMRTNINSKLAKSDTTGKWKPVGWFPVWTQVTGKPSFSTVAETGDYNDLVNKPSIPSGQINSDWNSNSGVNQILNKPNLSVYYLASNPNGYISSYTETDPLFNSKFSTKSTTDLIEGTNLYFTNSRARTSISGNTGISYNNVTGIITNSAPDQIVSLTSGNGIDVTGTYPNFTITNSNLVPTLHANVNRTLNNNFTVSTKEAFVKYDITLSVSNPLLAGVSTADAYLEYSINEGSTWTTLSKIGNSSGVGLAVAVAINNIQTVSLIGWIPGNALCRIRSAVTGSGTVTFITNSGQERY